MVGARSWPGLLLVVAVTASRAHAQAAPPQDVRFEAGEQLYGLSELIGSGDPLWAELFVHGWPTDQTHRHLTQEVPVQGAHALIAGYLGSGAGQPLSATAYEEARANRASHPA